MYFIWKLLEGVAASETTSLYVTRGFSETASNQNVFWLTYIDRIFEDFGDFDDFDNFGDFHDFDDPDAFGLNANYLLH